MEFHEKLQALRRQKGLTQEELAARLYVSRTAVSKWESGRGFPGIDSLKAVAQFFSVSIDELLSAQCTPAAAKTAQRPLARLRDPLMGLTDLAASLLLFLPLFATRAEGRIKASSLLTLGGVEWYLQAAYFTVVAGLALAGVLTLALRHREAASRQRIVAAASLMLGSLAVLLFAISLQPYAAVFAFALLIPKVALLIKG
jgi:transcriptional regulator with XRE-family HTH domain